MKSTSLRHAAAADKRFIQVKADWWRDPQTAFIALQLHPLL